MHSVPCVTVCASACISFLFAFLYLMKCIKSACISYAKLWRLIDKFFLKPGPNLVPTQGRTWWKSPVWRSAAGDLGVYALATPVSTRATRAPQLCLFSRAVSAFLRLCTGRAQGLGSSEHCMNGCEWLSLTAPIRPPTLQPAVESRRVTVFSH